VLAFLVLGWFRKRFGHAGGGNVGALPSGCVHTDPQCFAKFLLLSDYLLWRYINSVGRDKLRSAFTYLTHLPTKDQRILPSQFGVVFSDGQDIYSGGVTTRLDLERDGVVVLNFVVNPITRGYMYTLVPRDSIVYASDKPRAIGTINKQNTYWLTRLVLDLIGYVYIYSQPPVDEPSKLRSELVIVVPLHASQARLTSSVRKVGTSVFTKGARAYSIDIEQKDLEGVLRHIFPRVSMELNI
jgi:hypothetical protein